MKEKIWSFNSRSNTNKTLTVVEGMQRSSPVNLTERTCMAKHHITLCSVRYFKPIAFREIIGYLCIVIISILINKILFQVLIFVAREQRKYTLSSTIRKRTTLSRKRLDAKMTSTLIYILSSSSQITLMKF